ncbi:type IV secretory system conjugative DNA transfer family protein [Pontibaca methylaminivorans]|uniref:type IV secretory system conjugative DNA transfer family protein n=1 Tax=Pontibaca methylaminivorans TaxID=515897 RepID=UPI000978AA16|nr:type IV secretory system conjugative DNA transfer family protein [Pontibaca methylaminivorans]
MRRSLSRRNEERPLLTADEVRKLDPDKVILIPERQNPIMADRIIFYQDAVFTAISDVQKGPLPYPDSIRAKLEELRAEVTALRTAPSPALRYRLEPALAQVVANEQGVDLQQRDEADVIAALKPDTEAAQAKMMSFTARLKEKGTA